MAVVSRVATLKFDDGLAVPSSRTWVATAVTQDTAAGGSVDITVTQTTAGATPPGEANTLTLNLYDDSGGLVRAYTLTPGSASQTVTFHFTADGTSTGAARCGTVEIAIRATRTDVVAYDYETDGSPATAPTGFTATQVDRGWVRGTTTLVEDISNTSLGGAPTEPAAYDESLFVRTTAGAVSYVARALTVTLSAGSVTGSTNSTTAVTRDVTFSNVCDDRFPAAVTTVGVTVTVPNATLTGQPAWTFTTTTDDTITVDPRLTASHHFQVDDDVFGTTKNDTTKQMLSTQSGFLWTRLVNARSTGINGLTVTQTLDPVNPGTTISGSTVTATRDSQAGWTDKLDWTSAKPGGSWAKSVDVTAPADIDADTHLLSGTDTLTMLNTDPRIQVMVRVGPSAAGSEDRHLRPGDGVKVAVCPFNRVTRKKITADAAPTIALVRYDVTNGWEYLSTGGAWVDWSGGVAADSFTTIADPADTECWSYTFSSTSGWGSTDIVAVQVTFNFAGTPYGFYVPRELVGSANGHDGYALDAPGLALSGALSFR